MTAMVTRARFNASPAGVGWPPTRPWTQPTGIEMLPEAVGAYDADRADVGWIFDEDWEVRIEPRRKAPEDGFDLVWGAHRITGPSWLGRSWRNLASAR